jgi:diguanylate cyclase (GGDEF)-like protein/PAS domain S-box-containing protein
MRDIAEDNRTVDSLALLAAIVESCTDAIVSVGTDGVVRSWNRAAANLYGYSPGEILGRPAAALSSPERRDIAARNITEIVAGAPFAAYEGIHRRKDGAEFPVSIGAFSVCDDAGKFIGGSVIIRDITGQKQAEQALRESENRFRTLIQNSTDLITLIDPAGVVLYDSPGITGILGISPEQRLGFQFFDWIHADDLSFMRMLHEELLHSPGAKLRAQVRLRHADGSWRWCDSWAANLLAEPGVRALVTSFRDITELKGVETALRESEQRYRMLIEEANDAIFTVDLIGHCTALNGASERISGYSRQEALGMTLAQIVPAERLPDLLRRIEVALSGQSADPVETELIARDGRRVAVEVSARPQIRNGAPVGLLCIARDISQRKRSEWMELNRREVLEMVAQNQPLHAVMRRLEEMIEHDYPGATARISLATHGEPPEDRPNHSNVPIRAADGHVLGYIEIDHPEVWEVNDFEQLLLDSKANLASIALEHRQLTDRLAYQAHHDPLTGLPNRALLDDRLRQAVALARRLNSMVAVIYVDLDRFKFINDTLGHDVGDTLLKKAAKRLEGAIRESDTLARPGGDEFVAVLYGIENIRDAEQVGERILEAMREPFQVMGHELFASASVGLSLYPQDGEDAATLQKHADVAMYEAKNRGRNRFQKFAREMNSASHERLEIENQLHRALERGELVLYYQPLFQLSSGQLGGVEALLRWNHPKWGLLAPDRFIPVAEESGLIIPISVWVLQEACRQHHYWRQAGHSGVRIAVNISATQFTRTNLAEKVAEVLAAHEMQACYLDLELTEGVLMCDVEESTRQIAELQALGVRISIDDFGTGYSSLSYLQHLPIDDLKIDKCFVQGIGQAASTQRLVQAIVGLAHGLNMTATAEGVETENELAALRALGCDRVQGYLLGRPAPAGVCEAGWKAGGQSPILRPALDPDSLSGLRA